MLTYYHIVICGNTTTHTITLSLKHVDILSYSTIWTYYHIQACGSTGTLLHAITFKHTDIQLHFFHVDILSLLHSSMWIYYYNKPK